MCDLRDLALCAGAIAAAAAPRCAFSPAPADRSGRSSICSSGCAQSGERVVIDGPCLSACTLVLSTVPSNRICVTRRAVLGFHAARSIDTRGRMYAEPEASQRCSPPIPLRCGAGSAGAAD